MAYTTTPSASRVTALAATAVSAVRQSIFGGVTVANKLGSAPLLHSVMSGFLHGMDTALTVSAAIALVGLALTVLFLPRTTQQASQELEFQVTTDEPVRTAL